MNSIVTNEFDFIMEDEDTSTYIDDSDELINQAKDFIDKALKFSDRTYQGISVTDISELIFIGETDVMPWNHVSFTLDVNKLKDVNKDSEHWV